MKSYHSEGVSILLRKLIKYDVISFDIFDTLILRPFSRPIDLFLTLSPEHKMVNFVRIRTRAEEIVRKKAEEASGSREVTITQIYQQIAMETGIEVETGVQMEFQKELDFCYANPYMKAVFDGLKQEGKRIIIVSNMYYPQEMMEKLLKNCGYTGYEKLFVSCDHHRNKRGGELFTYIGENYLKGESVIHIGDNKMVDIEGAQAAGWDSHHYEICTDPKSNFHKKNISYLTGSYYNALIQNFDHNGFSREEGIGRTGNYYWLGYKYGGIVLLGYVNFIHRYCVEHGVDKVLFLARDGYLLQKLYNDLYQDIPSEYVLWSRRATLQVMPHIYLTDLFWHVVRRRLKEERTGEEFLKEMALEEIGQEMSFDTEQIITDENVEEFWESVCMQHDKIRQQAKKIGKAARMYLAPMLEGCRRVAIVDIGWRASGAISLDKLINDEWQMNCQVDCIVAGNTIQKKGSDSSFAVSGNVVSYMFSEINNLDCACRFNKRAEYVMPLFEVFCGAAPTPSFVGFKRKDEDYELEFDKPECENYEIIKKIQQGELDFVKEYIAHSKGYPPLLEITGRDAYFIFTSILKVKKLEKLLKNYSYPHTVGGVDNRWLIETLGEIWSLENLDEDEEE